MTKKLTKKEQNAIDKLLGEYLRARNRREKAKEIIKKVMEKIKSEEQTQQELKE